MTFATQNVITDPPFSRLDLIACRNLMIYLEPDIHQKMVAIFHFALKDAGFLFLGTSEAIGHGNDLFEEVSGRFRIYRRIGPARRVGGGLPIVSSERPNLPSRTQRLRTENSPDAIRKRIPNADGDDPTPPRLPDDAIVRQIETELHVARKDLQDTIEEMETSNEEMKASNEEMTAMNEELQSLNEELADLNSRLQDKVLEVEDSNNDFANLLNSSDVATVFLDRDLRIKRFTPGAMTLLNLIPSDVGRPFRDLAIKLDDSTLHEETPAVLETLAVRERELSASDGRWFIRRILPYRTGDHKIEGVVITYVEITLVKRAQQALVDLNDVLESRVEERSRELLNSEERWHTFIECTETGTVMVDDQATVIEANAVFARLAGYASRKDVIGRTMSEWTAEYDVQRLRDEIQIRREEGLSGHLEVDFRLADGTVPRVEITAARIETAKGRRVLCLCRDVTKRAEAAKRLREMALAREAAEKSDIAKSNFLAAVSHDLRTPLNAILGYSEALLSKAVVASFDQRTREYLENIHVAGGHLLTLINDVLDLSAAQSDKFTLNEENLVPAKIAASCRCLVDSVAEKKGITLKTGVDDDLPMLFADDRRVKQILVNLLGNAIKFSPGGSTVTMTGEVDTSGRLVFKVIDRGIGMETDAIESALEPFLHIENMTIRSKEGTGLGLPIASRMTKAHGGTLSIRSRPGEGTTVVVRFPRERTIIDRG